jgi:hypothetical protein
VLLAVYDTRRPTRDVDLQGRRIPNDTSQVLQIVRAIAHIHLDDGLVFDADNATADTIRDEDTYNGVRITLTGTLSAVRAASCYGIGQVRFTGDRGRLVGERCRRLPREERMRGYQEVQLRHADQPLTPLISFTHPDRAVYVFGPEDGSLDRAILGLCHRFVVTPTRHCNNLAAAV